MQGTVSARVDLEVKQEVSEVLKEIGLDMSTAINIYFKEIARSHKIPFELKADPFYSESNIKHLENMLKEYKKGTLKTEVHDLIEV